jgi:hypothetical protein
MAQLLEINATSRAGTAADCIFQLDRPLCKACQNYSSV